MEIYELIYSIFRLNCCGNDHNHLIYLNDIKISYINRNNPHNNLILNSLKETTTE
jgi:hypothetical protein